jgi:hypothetical protein
VFFASEPIDDSFDVPWGLRLDGESLWAIRRNGWLELGFQESYFLRTLQHLGWLVIKHFTEATHLGVIFEARRAHGVYEMSTIRLPPDEDSTWAAPETSPEQKHRYSGRRSVLSIERGLPSSSILIDATNYGPCQVRFTARHGRHLVEGVAEPRQDIAVALEYDPSAGEVIIEADTWRPSEILWSTDNRELGLAVRTLRIAAGDRSG